jgi:hypothetical protein
LCRARKAANGSASSASVIVSSQTYRALKMAWLMSRRMPSSARR